MDSLCACNSDLLSARRIRKSFLLLNSLQTESCRPNILLNYGLTRRMQPLSKHSLPKPLRKPIRNGDCPMGSALLSPADSLTAHVADIDRDVADSRSKPQRSPGAVIYRPLLPRGL